MHRIKIWFAWFLWPSEQYTYFLRSHFFSTHPVDTDLGLYIYADIVDICVDADIVDICVDTDTDSGFISSYRWSRPHLGAAVQQQLTAVRPRLPGGVVQRRAALAIPDLEIRPVVFE